MQNQPEKQPGSFRKFLQEKGYYMVLALCVLAVGVSGYLFVRTATDRQSHLSGGTGDASLSVPLTTADDEDGQREDSRRPTSAETAEEPVQDTAGTVDTDVAGEDAETEQVITVRPLEGDTIAAYSMDALAYNETTRDWRTHNGIDIAAAAGEEVAAARAGVVTAIYEDDAFGTTVAVEHSDGYTTHYANLSPDTAVSIGETVSAGQVLGTVGDTATVELARDSHLHFAVYHNQQPVDPEQFLLGL